MTTYRNFHSGEAQIQAESGVDTTGYDDATDQMFLPELNPSEERFVAQRTFSSAASIDTTGRPWASPLIGAAGELFTIKDLVTVQVRPRRFDGDPLFDNVAAMGSMGILYFNPSNRRRAKSLGHGSVDSDGSITYEMTRIFGICPKYIFKRDHDTETALSIPADHMPTVAAALTTDDQNQFTMSDTIFLASRSEQHGVDPTHRGGQPGFVTVIDDTTISLPDYVGNGMFQTLGNMLLDDRIGAVTIDYQTGRILQVTGRGRIQTADGDLTKRTLIIEIEEVRSTYGDVGTWTDIEPYDYSKAPL